MNQHTPGPWEIGRRAKYSINQKETGRHIAMVSAYCAKQNDGITNQANAHLIAAAPLMLEALLEQCHNCAEEKDYCLEHDCKVYMAIKAAKGEQE